MKTEKDYDDVIKTINLAKTQLVPDGNNCSICGDNDHQAFECHFNPLVRIDQLTERLDRHEGVEGGISSKCGHPVQCLYACAVVDGGPVRCFVCDRDEQIKDLKRIVKEKQG